MKKILFVSPGFSYGGSTTALLSILNSDLKQKFQFNIFSIAKGDNDSSTLRRYDIGLNQWTKVFYSDFSKLSFNERIRAFGLKVLRQLPGVSKLVEKWVIWYTIRQIEKNNYDFVVAFQEKRATEFCSHFSIRNKIAWLHCDYPRTYPRTEADLAIYEKYQRIVCVSKATKDSFLKYFPSLMKRTTYIYNLFDADNIQQKSLETLDDARFETSEFTIISVGRINHVKRFDKIPGIAQQLVERGLHFRWYVIGQPYSAIELEKLEVAIQVNKVQNQVIYLGGKSNPYPFFRAANLLVSVSESEACPMIFNEAKLLNLRIVTTDFPSAFEFVNPGIDGDISTIENMVDVIAKYIQKPFTSSLTDTFCPLDLNNSIISKIEQLLS